LKPVLLKVLQMGISAKSVIGYTGYMKIPFMVLRELGCKDKYDLKLGLPDTMWWSFLMSNFSKICGTTYGIHGEMYLRYRVN
jgi:hypothetical protein